MHTAGCTGVDTPAALCYNALEMTSAPSQQAPNDPPLVQIIGVTGLPEIVAGDPLGASIVTAAEAQGTPLAAGDLLVVTQKVVSKAEGRTVDLRDLEPSARALQLAAETGRDVRLLELIIRESRAIVKMDASRGVIITETRHGFICANSGIDASNVPGESVVALLPENPDLSAARIRKEVETASPGTTVGVIISDTFGRPWREGHVNFAIGVAGVNPMKDYRGTLDTQGEVLRVTSMAIADELASAGELVMAKANGIPVAIIKGYSFAQAPDSINALLRHPSQDLFR